MRHHRTAPPPDLATKPGAQTTLTTPAPAARDAGTFWAWRVDPKVSTLENLLAAKRFHRLHRGRELVRVHLRGELAAQLPPDLSLEVVVNDQIAVNAMYFEPEDAR